MSTFASSHIRIDDFSCFTSQLQLSNLDYQTILDTFTDNFAEGATPESEATPPPTLPTVKEEVEQISEPDSSAGTVEKLREPIPQIDRPTSPIPKRDSTGATKFQKRCVKFPVQLKVLPKVHQKKFKEKNNIENVQF